MTFEKFLEPGDTVVFFIRRHTFAFVSSVFILAIVGIFPLLIVLLLQYGMDMTLSRSVEDRIAVGVATYYLFFLTVAIVLWLDYYYDLYIVTNTHILDMDQSSLLSRKIAHISLARVQDVTTKIKGFWGNLLDFGNITVQTAGHEEDIILEDVPHPHEIAARIMKLHDDLISRDQRQGEIGHGEGVHPPEK